MTNRKVAVIFGGRSGEHVVSLRSAASIMEALKGNNYEIFPVGITREGTWIAGGDPWKVLHENNPPGECFKTALITDPVRPGFLMWQDKPDRKEIVSFEEVDLAFPVLHGPFGEDGTIQGLFEMANMPYVGPGVLASSVGMDKAVMKEVFLQKNLPVGPYLHFMSEDWLNNRNYWVGRVEKEIKFPCFIKPANLGSSVGISKAYDREQFIQGTEEAFNYDEKVVIETNIPGREIECSVLGDTEINASLPGEIIPNSDFYDYSTKYINDRSELIIPAKLDEGLTKEIQQMAVDSFKAICGSGMARVDFFVDSSKKITVNEVNTIPGFTGISMYPKLWEASGLPYNELVNRLVQIGLNRHERRNRLKSSPPV